MDKHQALSSNCTVLYAALYTHRAFATIQQNNRIDGIIDAGPVSASTHHLWLSELEQSQAKNLCLNLPLSWRNGSAVAKPAGPVPMPLDFSSQSSKLNAKNSILFFPLLSTLLIFIKYNSISGGYIRTICTPNQCSTIRDISFFG